jgi:two-component sensor histidine kinase
MTKLLGLRKPGVAIFALAFFALAILAAWRGYTLHQERAARLDSARVTVATASIYVANYIARTVDAAQLLTADTREYIADQGGLARVSPAALQSRIAERAQGTSIDDYVLVTDAGGRVIAYSDSVTPPTTSFADRAWFREHVDRGADVYLGPAVMSRLRDEVVYTYSEAIRGPDGSFQGIAVVGVSPTQPRPSGARAAGEPLAQLWTTDGRLITASHMDFDARGNPKPQSRPFDKLPSAPIGFLPGTADLMTAYKTADGHPLVATVTLSRAGTLGPWRTTLRDSLILLLIGGFMIGVLAMIAARFAGQDYRARLQLEATAAELSSALADKDVLLREIHHRVKNNLQITSSLIQLQARGFKDPAVRAAFAQTQQRLRSISMVHDVLYHEDTAARLDMAVYLSELAAEVGAANGAAERGVAVSVDAESARLSPGQVTPLGLCVAEVITNAFKHGFPEGRTGSIAVRARCTEAEIEVEVRDDGPGFAAGDTRPGSLGLLLIDALTRQLNGRSSFTQDGGTVFRLAFPRKT